MEFFIHYNDFQFRIMLSSGNEHSASEAFNIGLIDKVYSESMNIQECAKQFAQTISGKSLQSRRLSTKSVPDASKVIRHYF